MVIWARNLRSAKSSKSSGNIGLDKEVDRTPSLQVIGKLHPLRMEFQYPGSALLPSLYSKLVFISHWQKSQVCLYFGCCTADSQAEKDQNKLNNNLKSVNLETFASGWFSCIKFRRGKCTHFCGGGGTRISLASPCLKMKIEGCFHYPCGLSKISLIL